MNRKISGKMRRKLAGLFVAVVLALLCLLIRITYINAKSGDQYTKLLLSQAQNRYSSTVLPFKRGDILDRNGTVLATSEKMYNVILDCKVVNSDDAYVGPTTQALSEVFAINPIYVNGILTDEKTRDSQYQVVQKHISIEDKKRFENYLTGTEDVPLTDAQAETRRKVNGVWFEEEYVRTYPLKSLACDVIGFTYDGQTADWGMEGYYSNQLNGVNGRRFGYWDSTEDNSLVQTEILPVDGDTIVSTIDANIQKICEEQIARFNQTYGDGSAGFDSGAKNIGVLVMNPNNGEILAMAESNAFDLNDPRNLSAFYPEEALLQMSEADQLEALQKIWRNSCISDSYEPGSTFKPVTVAASLESAAVRGSETYFCDGAEVVAGTTIKCSHESGHGWQSVSDVIKNSCNDGIMQMAGELGTERFASYQRLFHFGSRTGIDLPGEASGILHEQNAMGSVELATSAFGQGFECTMVQEASAIASIINGGFYYRPHVVSRIVDSEGVTKKEFSEELMTQTVSTETADAVRDYMREAVEAGSAVYTKINGYSMVGKTGTAQKIPRGNGKYIVSFVGAVPADSPALMIYVIVDEPNVESQADNRFGQWVAKAVLKEVLPYMNIYPDEDFREETDIMRSDMDNPTGDVVYDTIDDTNVPEVSGNADATEVAGGNNQESEGYTNEEAGFEGE